MVDSRRGARYREARRQRTPMPIERVQQWVGGSLAFTSFERLAYVSFWR